MTQVSGGAAYKKLVRPNNSLSQGLQYWGGIKARENAAQKLKDERDVIRQEKEQKEFFDSIDDDAMSATLSQQKDFNDVAVNFVETGNNQIRDLGRQAREAYLNKDRMKAVQLQKRITGVRASIKSFNDLSGKLDKKLEWYLQNKDKLNPFDKRHKIPEAILKHNYIVDIDENGKLQMIIGLDKDGDGKISDDERTAGNEYLRTGAKQKGYEFKKFNPYDIYNGSYDQYQKVDIEGKNGLVDKVTSTMKLTKFDKLSNNFITTTKNLNKNQVEGMRKSFKVAMGDPQTAAWVMNSMGITDKVDGFKDDELEKGVDYLMEIAKSKFGFETSLKQRGLTRQDKKAQFNIQMNERRQARKDANKRARDLAQNRIDLSKLKNTQKKGGWKGSDGKKLDESDLASMIYAYKAAKEVSKTENNDKAVKKILVDKYNFNFDTDWNLWGNEFDAGSSKVNGNNIAHDLKQTDVFGVARALSNELGVEFNKEFINYYVQHPEEFEGKSNQGNFNPNEY